jgi:hypothetical protein
MLTFPTGIEKRKKSLLHVKKGKSIQLFLLTYHRPETCLGMTICQLIGTGSMKENKAKCRSRPTTMMKTFLMLPLIYKTSV